MNVTNEFLNVLKDNHHKIILQNKIFTSLFYYIF